MAKGKIVYGGTTYNFERNYSKAYVDDVHNERIVNISTDGVITAETVFSRKEYELYFHGAPDTQVAALKAAEAYGLVIFYPEGTGTSYSGIISFDGKPQKIRPNYNNFTLLFMETK